MLTSCATVVFQGLTLLVVIYGVSRVASQIIDPAIDTGDVPSELSV